MTYHCPLQTFLLKGDGHDEVEKFLLAVLPTPCGECASLEHTLTTALAVFLPLIHSWNWLQLPACLVRTCKLKQEERGRNGDTSLI